jgi:hypothetical protein
MTGCFANIRGVEHPDKQRFMRDLIRDNGVCFLGLSETIKSQYTPSVVQEDIKEYEFILEICATHWQIWWYASRS